MEPSRISAAIVRIKGCLVYDGTPLCPLNVAFPQGAHSVMRLNGQSVAMTCAQMAIIPRNSAHEANAAPSSATPLTLTPPRPGTEQDLPVWSVLFQAVLIGPSRRI